MYVYYLIGFYVFCDKGFICYYIIIEFGWKIRIFEKFLGKEKKLFLYGSIIILVNRLIVKFLLDFDCYDILYYKLNDFFILKFLFLGKVFFEIINIYYKNDNKNSFIICINLVESGLYNICIFFVFFFWL